MKIFASIILLLTCFTMPGLTAQRLEWEQRIPEPESSDVTSRPSYTGVHLLPLDDAGFLITGRRGAGFASGITRVRADGSVLWSRSVQDNFANISPELNYDGEAFIHPRLSMRSAVGQLLFVGQALLLGSDGGGMYFLSVNEEGESIDTVAGLQDSVGYTDLSSVIHFTESGDFWSASYFDYPQSDNPFSLYLAQGNAWGRISGDPTAVNDFYYPGKKFWTAQGYPPRALIEGHNGEVVVFGGASVPDRSRMEQIPYVVQVRPEGDEVWSTNPAQWRDGTGLAYAIDTAERDGFVATYKHFRFDTAQSTVWVRADVVVMRLDSVGEFLWDWGYGEEGRQYTPMSVRELPGGDVVVGGYVGNISEGSVPRYENASEQMFLARVSSSGETVWMKEWGAEEGSDRIEYMIILPDGDLLVTGRYGEDLYLARIGPEISSVRATSSSGHVLDLTILHRHHSTSRHRSTNSANSRNAPCPPARAQM